MHSEFDGFNFARVFYQWRNEVEKCVMYHFKVFFHYIMHASCDVSLYPTSADSTNILLSVLLSLLGMHMCR